MTVRRTALEQPLSSSRAIRTWFRPMDDRTAGLTLFVASTGLFAYYTVWVLVTPSSSSDTLCVPRRAHTHASRRSLRPLARPRTPFRTESASPSLNLSVQVLRWFPDRAYAVLVPAYAGACLVAGVLAYFGVVMLRHRVARETESTDSSAKKRA